MTALAFEAVTARVQAAFPGVAVHTTDNGQHGLVVPAAELVAIARFLRDERDLAFDSLMDLTGFDLLKYPGPTQAPAIAVLYLLHSMRHRHKVALRVLAPRDACTVPTVSEVWPAALYFEREVWDLLGVRFAGHPDLRRIMCPDDWVGHPLRKDYEYPVEYQGVAHLRDGQRFENTLQSKPAAVVPGSNGA